MPRKYKDVGMRVGRLVKLLIFCLPDGDVAFVSFLQNGQICDATHACVIVCARRKRPPLVRGHHWSPSSRDALLFNW